MANGTFNGLLVIDKPAGITSRAAVDRATHWFPRRTRIGHTGTLDPLATGVLVLCIGRATRLAEYVQRMTKTYRAGILLGAKSDTDDAEGRVTSVENVTPPSRLEVEQCLQEFLGEVEQTPPAFSAAKTDGTRAYDRARRGQQVQLAPRQVHIYGIDLLAYEYPHLNLEVRCGKGTYIRSLARDLGERLGCGALIQSLRRTRVGPFGVESALSLDADEMAARAALLPNRLAVAELPTVALGEEVIKSLKAGQRIEGDAGSRVVGPTEVAAFDQVGNLVAICLRLPECDELRPVKVFPEHKS
jgi:tRNA pseudouridine55 synthase